MCGNVCPPKCVAMEIFVGHPPCVKGIWPSLLSGVIPQPRGCSPDPGTLAEDSLVPERPPPGTRRTRLTRRTGDSASQNRTRCSPGCTSWWVDTSRWGVMGWCVLSCSSRGDEQVYPIMQFTGWWAGVSYHAVHGMKGWCVLSCSSRGDGLVCPIMHVKIQVTNLIKHRQIYLFNFPDMCVYSSHVIYLQWYDYTNIKRKHWNSRSIQKMTLYYLRILCKQLLLITCKTANTLCILSIFYYVHKYYIHAVIQCRRFQLNRCSCWGAHNFKM